MNVVIKSNVAFINTGISAADVKKALKFNDEALVVKDEEGAELYKLTVASGDKGSMSKFGMTTNTVTGGSLAITMPVTVKDDATKTKAAFVDSYGVALAAADTHLATIATQIAAALGNVDSITEGITVE